MQTTISLNDQLIEIKKLLDTNPKTTLYDIFKVIPRTTLATNTGMNKMRIKAKAGNPGLFKISELVAISKYLQVSPERIFALAMASFQNG